MRRSLTPVVDRHVLIQPAVVAMIAEASRSCRGQQETGGILLGSIRGPHIECVEFTRAGPNDLRGAYRFTLQDRLHQRKARAAWSKSGSTVTFIGGWHTHPYGAPVPSSIDITSWMMLARDAGYPMLFLIAAPDAWNGFRMTPRASSGYLNPLTIIENGTAGVVLK